MLSDILQVMAAIESYVIFHVNQVMECFLKIGYDLSNF